MREKGSMKQILTKYEVQGQVCPDLSGKPLDFGAVYTAFIILLFGFAMAIILFCIEKISDILNLNIPILNMYGVGDQPFYEPDDFVNILASKDAQIEAMTEKIVTLESKLKSNIVRQTW